MHPPPRIARSTPLLHNTKRLQLNAPPHTGRFYYLLTLKRNRFWLTKVNKIDCITQIINELRNTNCNPQLQQKTAELTKSARWLAAKPLILSTYIMATKKAKKDDKLQ
ncbi:MAG TPA: hypothetical protein VIN07_03745, partial [Flavipsychrobacter sp.]